MTDTSADICSLDYLTGTLATAYKGLITSLVAKDFCMTEANGTVLLKGRILAMPEGNYLVSLIREGRELSRTDIKNGFFELEVEAVGIREASNLQIDVLQNGRHIGTFLLKRAKAGEFFMPAMELYKDIRGPDLKLLTAYLGDKPGLLKKAEEIITLILSSKKNWSKLSEEINSFSHDTFWFARDAFYGCYHILVRHALNACEKNGALRDKRIANFLSLAELPVENETDRGKMHSVLSLWVGELKGASACLACYFPQARRVLTAVIEGFGDIDPDPAMRVLVLSLKRRAEEMPALSDRLIDSMRMQLTPNDLKRMKRFGESAKESVMKKIHEAEISLEEKKYGEIFAGLGDIDRDMPGEAEMIDAFFETLQRNVTPSSAGPLAEAAFGFLGKRDMLSAAGRKRAMKNAAGLLIRLTDLGLIGICENFIGMIGKAAFRQDDDILLNVEVASAILRSGSDDLIDRYVDSLVSITVPSPGIAGFSSETWAEIAHPSHIERISRFMSIIGLDREKFRKVLVHLICNLRISGVFIPDDRLFQRNVSAYLNSGPPRLKFLLDYMLLQTLPVYYSEVGATGRIRDYTTEIDSWGNDTVLYFLRKQVHVNASNNNVRLVEAVIRSWTYDDPEILMNYVPMDVFEKITPGLPGRYSPAIRTLLASVGVFDDAGLHLEKILSLDEDELLQRSRGLEASGEVRSKIFCICMLYRELVQKYGRTGRTVATGDIYAQLDGNIEKLRALKETIVSPEKTEAVESFFFKRHIAFGIPSVMGSYREPKFDAVGEALRIEEASRILFESVIAEIGGKKEELADGNVGRWIKGLGAMNELLKLHELGNRLTDEVVAAMEKSDLHISQITDLLKIWQRELAWAVEFLTRTFYQPLTRVLRSFPKEELPEHLKRLGPESGDFADKAADVIMRDIVNTIPGLTELDRSLEGMKEKLISGMNNVGDEILKSSGLPAEERRVFAMDELSDADAMRLSPLIGGKAKNLVYLANKGLRVPSGIVLSASMTAGHREYATSGEFREVLAGAIRKIGEKEGAVFGDPTRPLFVSVRSGSYISMPGILSSILYCGMNRETLTGFIQATGNPRLGWDSYRRFIENYGTVVHGLDASFFGETFTVFMRETGIARPEKLDARAMEEIAGRYLRKMSQEGLMIPDNVYEQLARSIGAIYGSWSSEKAMLFRKAMDISEHWGTSVAIMKMVYGNDRGCGASVFFTRDPFSYERSVYGDTKESATGADIVYGGAINRPLSKQQATGEEKSLEEVDPELFVLHREVAEKIEDAMGGLPQEVEVTYTRGPDGRRLMYVLQTRRMEFHRGFRKRFDDVCKVESNVIGRGAGVHGGALSGVATFGTVPEDIRRLKDGMGMPVILIRPMASTDDVALMPVVDGVLTSAGGVASHASVLAQKFNLTAVVGCAGMKLKKDDLGNPYAVLGGHTITEGSYLSMDGSTGLVYAGLCAFTVPSHE
jgi:pyruvate,orthophosphate dikinase